MPFISLSWHESMKRDILTRVPNEDKDYVLRALHLLMFCYSKTHFDETLRRCFIESKYNPAFLIYINAEWTRINVSWKILWS